MLKLKLQYFGHLMRKVDSFEKTLMLGKIEGRRRRDLKFLFNGIAASREVLIAAVTFPVSWFNEVTFPDLITCLGISWHLCANLKVYYTSIIRQIHWTTLPNTLHELHFNSFMSRTFLYLVLNDSFSHCILDHPVDHWGYFSGLLTLHSQPKAQDSESFENFSRI